MGTLVGHVVPSVVFVLVGFWHLVSALCNYVRQGREYTSKAWYAMGWFPHGLKHMEIYLMVVLIPFAIFYELGVSTSFRPLVDSMIPLNRVASFEHTTTLFMFWLFAVIVLFSDTTPFLPLPAEASFLFAGLAFALEWISIAHEAARNTGLESQCNLLLAYISGLCAASAGLALFIPTPLFYLFSRYYLLLHHTVSGTHDSQDVIDALQATSTRGLGFGLLCDSCRCEDCCIVYGRIISFGCVSIDLVSAI